MKLVIDIPEELKARIDNAWNPIMLDNIILSNLVMITTALKNSTTLRGAKMQEVEK